MQLSPVLPVIKDGPLRWLLSTQYQYSSTFDTSQGGGHEGRPYAQRGQRDEDIQYAQISQVRFQRTGTNVVL